jgi:pyridoxine 5-phosphate synthase
MEPVPPVGAVVLLVRVGWSVLSSSHLFHRNGGRYAGSDGQIKAILRPTNGWFIRLLSNIIPPVKHKQTVKGSRGVAGLRLGVNIDHVATLRQVRGTKYPDVIEAAAVCEAAGARGITVHLREDRRHIQDADVYALRLAVKTNLNLEMANSVGIRAIAMEVGPDEVCLVPERRQELTTEGGLDVAANARSIGRTVGMLEGRGVLVSLFIAPDSRQVIAAKSVGARCIELHTGAFCDARGTRAGVELNRLITAARLAHGLGMQVNAGHGINMDNVAMIMRIPHLHTLNIGHSIVSRAVIAGLRCAVLEMLMAMKAYRRGERL